MSCELDELSRDSGFPFLTTLAIRRRLEESFQVASLKKYTKQIQDYAMDKIQNSTPTTTTNTHPLIVATQSTSVEPLTVTAPSTSVEPITIASPSISVESQTAAKPSTSVEPLIVATLSTSVEPLIVATPSTSVEPLVVASPATSVEPLTVDNVIESVDTAPQAETNIPEISYHELDHKLFCKKSINQFRGELGLFTKETIPVGTVFGTFDGILVKSYFFTFYDYNSSYILVNNKSITVDCRLSSTLVKNVVDPLDMSKVNAEIIDIESYGMVLRAIKPIDANGEVFISFGQRFWKYYFSNINNLTPDLQLLQKRANACYQIIDKFVTRILETNKINIDFTNNLIKYQYWKFADIMGGGLVNFDNGCYMTSTIQCLAYIPNLARVLMEHEYFQDIQSDTLLYNFISLIKLIHKDNETNKPMEKNIRAQFKKKWTEEKKNCMRYIAIRRTDINASFTPKVHQDSQDFLISFIDKLCLESIYFGILKHHLFDIYIDDSKICECNHVSTKRIYEPMITLDFVNDTDTNCKLIDLLTEYTRRIPGDRDDSGSPSCKCCKCRNNNKESYTESSFYKLPPILIIHLKRYKQELVEDKRKKTMTLTTKIISAEVEFDRYITLKEGTHSLAYYELVSFNVFKGKGTTVNEGHYESYVLSPDKKWYNKNDDNKITESESAFDVINNHKDKAYIYYYRRIPAPLTREVVDLLADSYGNDGRCAVAFDLSLGTNKNGKLADTSFQILLEYKKYYEKHDEDIIKYVEKNNIGLNFFRASDTKDLIIAEKSCVANGTCGFQLDFLLHERIVEQDNSDERDYYITTPKGKPDKHITTPAMMKRFIDHMRNKINLKNIYFKKLLRPTITSSAIKKSNEYSSYKNWIYQRSKLYSSKIISDETYMEELTYYKYVTATDFIEKNASKERFLNNNYYKNIKVEELTIPIWFSISMFNYCKLNHNFSIFYNTKNVIAPYLPNYMILYYSTIRNEASYRYTFKEIKQVCEDFNHGGLNENEHFFLLKTFLFNDNFYNSLRSYHLYLQFIIKYGEFKNCFYNSFSRFNKVNINKAYDYVEDYNVEVVSQVGKKRKIIELDDDDDKQDELKTKAQKKELVAITIKNDLTNSLLEDQNQNGVEMDVVNAANELKSQLFDMLLLTLTSENNDITRKLKKNSINK